MLSPNFQATRAINRRQGWVGHLWQGRFASCALDPEHLLAAARYVELNPVRARLVDRPEDWPWSSARAHLASRDDELVTAAPLSEAVGDWSTFLGSPLPAGDLEALRRHERTGRPSGSAPFVAELEHRLGRRLRLGKRRPESGSGQRLNGYGVPNFPRCPQISHVRAAPTTGPLIRRRSRKAVSMPARRRPTGSSATMPGSATGSPAPAAESWSPKPSARWKPRSRSSPASRTIVGSANPCLCWPKTLIWVS